MKTQEQNRSSGRSAGNGRTGSPPQGASGGTGSPSVSEGDPGEVVPPEETE
jgi:hypothetical protein